MADHAAAGADVIVGFTGTQQGMTKVQRQAFRELLAELKVSVFHHGDCIGADIQAHNTVLKRTSAKVVVHPPSNESKRAFAEGQTFTYKKAPYLVRNRNIVNRCSHLIATPSGPEELRSGTWSTVRYAKRIGRPVTIVYPDGTLERVAGKNINALFELSKHA